MIADAWGSSVSIISCLDSAASQPSVTAPGMHGTDYKPEQVTRLSNQAGVNPQPPIISWLLAQAKAWLCGSMGEDTNFSALKHVVLSPGGDCEQPRSYEIWLCPSALSHGSHRTNHLHGPHVTQLHAACLVTERVNSAEGSHLLKQFSLGWSTPVRCLNVLSASPFSVLKSSL